MSGGLFDGMTTSRVAALAAMVMSAPMVAAFAPSGVPMGLQQRTGAISRAASAIPTLRTPASRCTLRMQEEVAGVSEVSDQEQRSLDKTRTNKRPRSDNKNKKPLTDYTVGEMTKGKIVSIMPYGAFVDVGTTTDGLVHVSQIADEFVSDIESVVKVGQEVECRIVSVDTDNNKISLSMRSENAKPAGGGGGGGRGKRAELPEEFKNYDDQKFIPGKVASVMDYGCFVTIGEGIEALVHVSEMAEERVSKPDAVVKVGQDVQVRIISFDKSKKRLSLSMKQWTESAPRDETDDIKNYTDPIPEDQKTSFQIAWEAAQKVSA